MIRLLRKITPKFLKKFYHYCLAKTADFIYRHPSNKLIVIGVTGTTGKSTTVYLLAKILEQAGFKVGVASTIFFKVDGKEKINDRKMTMVGRFALQKMIKSMVKANCQYAIIETTSEGIEQFRHLGINYDVLLFTNLSPEHIQAHGSFENYKNAKLKLFKKLGTEKVKLINNKKVSKTIIVNLDDQHALDFLNYPAELKLAYSLENKSTDQARVTHVDNPIATGEGISFSISHVPFSAKLFGKHNIYNLTAAMMVATTCGLSLEKISRIATEVSSIPGRLEFIEAGQNFKIIVDYAFEPKAMTALYEVVEHIPHKKVIHVLGGTGGGRDVARRPIIGGLAGTKANVVIVTNEDPYDEDPQEIINQVASGAKKTGKTINKDLFKILDRREAIKKALILAKKDDIVLVTGKGSEQAMVVAGGKKVFWDDRSVIREELRGIKT